MKIEYTVTRDLHAQDTFYLLWDGARHARHGTPDASGLLVFASLDQAERFRRTVGAGLPGFQAVQADLDEVVRAGVAAGGYCVANGLRVSVLSVNPRTAPLGWDRSGVSR